MNPELLGLEGAVFADTGEQPVFNNLIVEGRREVVELLGPWFLLALLGIEEGLEGTDLGQVHKYKPGMSLCNFLEAAAISKTVGNHVRSRYSRQLLTCCEVQFTVGNDVSVLSYVSIDVLDGSSRLDIWMIS